MKMRWSLMSCIAPEAEEYLSDFNKLDEILNEHMDWSNENLSSWISQRKK